MGRRLALAAGLREDLAKKIAHTLKLPSQPARLLFVGVGDDDKVRAADFNPLRGGGGESRQGRTDSEQGGAVGYAWCFGKSR